MEFLAEYVLISLFKATFLAATILPLSSEALLLLIIAKSNQIMIPVLVASAGNIAGSFLNYYLGVYYPSSDRKNWPLSDSCLWS